MPKSRSFKVRPPGSLAGAQTDLVAAVGGTPRAAELSRVKKTQIARYTDDAEPNTNMPADVIRDLEAYSGDPIVTRFLAAEQGFVLLAPSPAHDAASTGAAVAAFAKECADVFATASDALADGKVTPEEAGKIIAEMDEALEGAIACRIGLAIIRDGGAA